MTNKKNLLALGILITGLCIALYVNWFSKKTWLEQTYQYDTYVTDDGHNAYIYKDKEVLISNVVPYQSSPINQATLSANDREPTMDSQWVVKDDGQLVLLKPAFHYGFWSLLPALLTICLCLLTKEPLTALLSGIVTGAIMLGHYDITNRVIIPSLSSEGSATILLLYLWLLGGLLGIWSKTGAAQAFANYMSRHFIKGPRSAKLISWFLGIIFFQGGTMSTTLVGTTVRPMADDAKVSHEEMVSAQLNPHTNINATYA